MLENFYFFKKEEEEANNKKNKGRDYRVIGVDNNIDKMPIN